MVVLDTSIIIDHLRTKDANSALMNLVKEYPKEILAISLITIQELYEGISTKNKQKEQYMLSTIAPLRILPYNLETAQLAGELARNCERPLELADAAIAASCILQNATLFTLNKKDFESLKGLTLLKK